LVVTYVVSYSSLVLTLLEEVCLHYNNTLLFLKFLHNLSDSNPFKNRIFILNFSFLFEFEKWVCEFTEFSRWVCKFSEFERWVYEFIEFEWWVCFNFCVLNCEVKLMNLRLRITVVWFFCCFLCGDEDVSTDGKWCYIVFWVVGKQKTRWSLLKKRMVEACPACSSASGISYYRSDLQPPKPPDVFLLKFCCHDRKGLLHGNFRFTAS
jgi:hypothetical protein